MCLFCKEIKCCSTINVTECSTTVFYLELKLLEKLGFDRYTFDNSEPSRILTPIQKYFSFVQLKPASHHFGGGGINYFQLLSPYFTFVSSQDIVNFSPQLSHSNTRRHINCNLCLIAS